MYQENYKTTAKEIIRAALEEKPLDIIELIALVRSREVPFSQRATKEAAWQMAEDGEAFWNYSWKLELR